MYKNISKGKNNKTLCNQLWNKLEGNIEKKLQKKNK
jgi:hypothetical protein